MTSSLMDLSTDSVGLQLTEPRKCFIARFTLPPNVQGISSLPDDETAKIDALVTKKRLLT